MERLYDKRKITLCFGRSNGNWMNNQKARDMFINWWGYRTKKWKNIKVPPPRMQKAFRQQFDDAFHIKRIIRR